MAFRSECWYVLFYAAMALAVLSKGLIGVVLPGGVIFWYALLRKKFFAVLRDSLYIPGIVVFFAITVPWFYLVCRENPEFFDFFFVREHFERFTSTVHDRYEPVWYFIPLIIAGFFPWVGFLPTIFSRRGALRSMASEGERDGVVFLAIWFAVIFAFFSLSGSKLIPYIVPCIPPATILLAVSIERNAQKLRPYVAANGALLLLFVTAGFVYAFSGKLGRGEGLLIASLMTLSLIPASVYAFRRLSSDSGKAVKALSIGALLFAVSLQSVYPPVGRMRSVKSVADVVAEVSGERRIAVYGEVLHSIPFYVRQRVMLVDYYGELEFGANLEGGEWFPDRESFMRLWEGGVPLVVVVRERRYEMLFPDGESNVAARYKAGRDYIILTNEVAPQ